MISSKQRLFVATSGAVFFALCGVCVYLVGANLYLSSLIRTIGVLMILGGILAAIFLLLFLPKR